jgi:hypothetical protein
MKWLRAFANSLIKVHIITALVVTLCGCASTQPIRFGMFQVPEQDLGQVKELGVDFVVGSSGREYLDAAKTANLSVIAPAEAPAKHPAVVGSMLKDEPDLQGISPEQVATEYKAAKRHARRPIYLNLSSGFSAEAYRDDCDVVMFDWYPVNWTPIETFYSHLRAARMAAGKKSFFAVIQTFDWSKYPEMMPAREYRKPTAAEVKAMTIWAAMNGAKGIAYYPYDDGRASLKSSPELAAAISESIALVRNYDWLFELPRAWIEYPFQFTSSADKTNAIAETSIAIRAARVKEHPETTFIVAANTTERPIVVKSRVKFDEVGEEIRFEPLEAKFLTARIDEK